MADKKKPNAFLAAMQEVEPTPLPHVAETTSRVPIARSTTRVGLKHIGGYLDRDTVEKVAILRARLACDNSALLKRAINDLYRKQEAKRSFGDD